MDKPDQRGWVMKRYARRGLVILAWYLLLAWAPAWGQTGAIQTRINKGT